MNKYVVQYQWYEESSLSIIIADSEEEAIKQHIKLVNNLDCNYELESKYGYGGSVSPFHWNKDEETFEQAYDRFIETYRNLFIVLDISNSLGLVTDKGFYNGKDE